MNKTALLGLFLIALGSFEAHAACTVSPLTTNQLSGATVYGQILSGDECRGLGSRATYAADYYSFEAKIGDTLTASFWAAGSDGTKNYLITVLNPEGVEIANNINATSSNASFVLPLTTSGAFKIVVSGYTADVSAVDGVVNYAMTLKSSSPTQPAIPVIPCNIKPLSTNQLAGAIIYGQLLTGGQCRGLGSRSAYTADYYSFEGKAGDTISAGLRTAGSDANTNYLVTLLNPQGVEIANNIKTGENANAGFILPLLTSGTYKIVVSGYAADVDATIGVISYAMIFKSGSSQAPSCQADTYNNNKLTINTVEVPNDKGGTLRYKATLTLQPSSNPLTFTLDKADLLN
ncbi:MAG: hypothetical protein HOP02_03800 [Methylococcaceae bacterium]|nr:hypothetical protein [Methylococcaceae bacterium]